ncbi:MAG: GIY-YIG nuclease family protein [Oscillatoriales cyanobacterium SM2_2_1]|nr:GIY-YIG nuclease family protein [Oscillatoriales cyanobacterium SM2_2_1]
MSSSPQQYELFAGQLWRSPKVQDGSDCHSMSLHTLQGWQQKIAGYQKQMRDRGLDQQMSLLGPEGSPPIDPWDLDRYPPNFYRYLRGDRGDACLYFVLDRGQELLLYVGETVHSRQRWRGEHDCKRYLDQYHTLHLSLNLPAPTIDLCFWWDAPKATRQRQKLEQKQIQQWRSPFNKENWHHWQTPFVTAIATY